MRFTYTEQPVPTGWWTVAELPIGLKVRFDEREFNEDHNPLKPKRMNNSCGVLWRLSSGWYRVEWSKGHASNFRITMKEADPFRRIHITGIVP